MKQLTIVAGDFIDLDGGQVSMASAIGRGLLGARRGQEVRIELPAGERRFKVLDLVTLPEQAEGAWREARNGSSIVAGSPHGAATDGAG